MPSSVATRRSPSGATSNALSAWSFPSAIEVAPDGDLLVATDDGIHRFGPDGARESTTRVGFSPCAIALGPDGTLYASDCWGHRVVAVDSEGAECPIAGDGTQGFAGDGGSARDAQLSTPLGLDVAADGTIY